MQVVLLSGGAGKRLWPLASEDCPKQFIQLYQSEKYGLESMLQRVYHQIQAQWPDASVTISASATHVGMIQTQVGEKANVCIEPARRDTFPAIALACAYLADVEKTDADEMVVVCPVDAYVQQDYYDAVQSLYDQMKKHPQGIGILGVKPTAPSTQFGYILPASSKEFTGVSGFHEKPDETMASELIRRGALWNTGTLVFRLREALRHITSLTNMGSYDELLRRYRELPAVSFDHAVLENAEDVFVLNYDGEWSDMGTWGALCRMQKNTTGDVTLDNACRNVYAVNELPIPLLCMGLKDIVIGATDEGILISDIRQCDLIKPYVERIKRPKLKREEIEAKQSVNSGV